MQNFIITIIMGTLIGYTFYKLKVPGGMMVGSIVGVSLFNIFTGMAYMPVEAKVIAQIIAGAYIGVGLEKGDISRLRNIFKPMVTILIALIFLNITVGFIIYYTSPMDLVTSLMCAIPGGMSDIPIISEEMGADSGKVAVMQFVRMVFGIGVFPSMIAKVSSSKHFRDEKVERESYKREVTKVANNKNLLLTFLVAGIFGSIGRLSGMPSGVLVFSMLSIIGFKFLTNKAYLPRWVRRLAQVLSGTYIGSGMVYNDVLEIKFLLGPAIVLILGYAVTCLVVGTFMHKRFNMPIKDAMLACTPAGAADMALISADIGVESADVIVIQVIRLVVVLSLFPQIINGIVSILG